MPASPLLSACRHVLGRPGPVAWARWDPTPPARSFHPDDPRLLACVGGRLGIRLGGDDGAQRLVLAPGSFAVVPPGCWFSHHDSPDCRLLNVALRREGLDCRLRRRDSAAWRDEHIGLSPHGAFPRGIARALELCAELARAESVIPEALDHACRCVVAGLAGALESGLDFQGYRNRRHDLRWRQLRDCILEHLDQDLGRDRVADLLGIHPNHVSRICAQRGERFVDLVNRSRVDAACRMMCDGSLPITAIAGRCGFGSAQYFSRIFRRIHGQSPGAWRAAQASTGISRSRSKSR